MKKNYNSFLGLMRLFSLLLCMAGSTASYAQLTGNPLFTGADPEIHYFNGKYYIYVTAEAGKRFHAYSSSDLTNWKDEGVIFDIGPQCSWAENNGWAPGVAFRNNKYYFYYTAEVKLGVAVGNSPTGPFTDLGYPFIGTDPFTDDIIDAMVFTDDDGQAYIYYGGSGKSRMVVRKLNPDMISLASGASDITPQDYTEGPFLLKRDGIYYMTYSNGAWYNETYNVRYATSTSPMGPWTYRGVILQSNIEDKGPGHHSIIKIGNCDEYYMVYHRYENGVGGSRVIAIDRMNFNGAGLIENVNMTNYGVESRIPDNSCPATSIVSGATYKLVHRGTNQCLDVLYNSNQPGANVQQYTDNGNDAQRWIATLEADGFYKLRHKGTDQVLDVDKNSNQSGANVQQWTDLGNDAQRWKLEAMSDGYFKITHKGTNQCLDVSQNSNQPNANVQQYTDNNGNAQRWKLELIDVPIVSGGQYRLMHKTTNQCLDVVGNSNQEGANVQQYTDNGNDAQRWYITQESDGFYKLRHKGTTMVLDVNNNSNVQGTNVQQWSDLGSDAQRWKLDRISDGYFKLTHKGTTQCLDVANNLAAPGTNVAQWDDNGNDAQRWKLDLIPTLSPINGNGDGLTGNYFNGMNFESSVYSRKDATIGFDWGLASPNAAVNADRFSVRWSGQVQPRYSGEYTFYLNSDNGRRLWVNGQLLIDKWNDEWGVYYAGKILLNAGQKYDIRVEYFENDGAASCKLEWSSVFQPREVVPSTQLYSAPNQLPSVSLTAPVSNATYTAPASIIISANAADADGTISSVGFYNGSTLLGSDNSAPYTFVWNAVAAGTYSISARANDNQGATVSSAAVTVTVTAVVGDNVAPSISLTAPTNNQSYNAPASVTISANAADADGTVSKVEFYNGATKIGDDATSPYSFSWTNVAAGTYSITAKATDNKGASTTSGAVNITVKTVVVNQPPTISLTSPTNNQAYNAPASVTISANATDADGTVSKVEFYNGATKLGEDATAPYSFVWSNVAAGTYSISARAIDNSNATTNSSSVSIKVNTVVTDACASIPQYVENNGYVAGSSVKNGGRKYQCKEWPYSGWCNGGSWAYAPGSGAYWADAWYDRGACNARIADDVATLSSQIAVSPNPTLDDVQLQLPAIGIATVYNSRGEQVIGAHEISTNESISLRQLPAGLYLIKVEIGQEVVSKVVVKN